MNTITTTVTAAAAATVALPIGNAQFGIVATVYGKRLRHVAVNSFSWVVGTAAYHGKRIHFRLNRNAPRHPAPYEGRHRQ